ncbi:MAG: DUF4215 domain-containing protein [Deltaproteobacteria bacterium]|nr:DUF4215 domain-containing protein [Deltaproteobacteria bacterium]
MACIVSIALLAAASAAPAHAALNPLVSRMKTAIAIWKLAVNSAKVRHRCGTAIEQGELAWSVNCNEDPVSLGGAGTGDAEVDADLEKMLTKRPGAYLKLRDAGLPSEHGVDTLCEPASDDWSAIDTCLYQLGLAHSKQLFSIIFNPTERSVSMSERDCRRALGNRVRSSYRRLIINRANCFSRNGLLGSGELADRYDCMAPAVPPTRGIPATQLMRIDDGVGSTIKGVAGSVFEHCPDYLAGINFPSPLSDPTGGVFGSSDLAQGLLENVVPMSDAVLERLYDGAPYCGDGVLQADIGEQCDDGNRTNCDGCEYNCQLPSCGNAVGCASEAEECDDGDAVSEDGCTPACVLEYCGDGATQAGLEELCDDGNNADGDGCSANCQTEP